jgi:hypothetical protein
VGKLWSCDAISGLQFELSGVLPAAGGMRWLRVLRRSRHENPLQLDGLLAIDVGGDIAGANL